MTPALKAMITEWGLQHWGAEKWAKIEAFRNRYPDLKARWDNCEPCETDGVMTLLMAALSLPSQPGHFRAANHKRFKAKAQKRV